MVSRTLQLPVGATLALLVALAGGACGGGAKAGTGATTPTSTAPPVMAPPGAPVETAPGAPQTSVNDTPSSGAPATDRPKMSADAATAYSAGITAFQGGDLDGAKSQFNKATSADSKAYQAYYSLGVVLERLGDTSGALSAYRKATAALSDYEPAIVAYAVLLARSGKGSEADTYLQDQEGKMPKSAAVTAARAEVASIGGSSGDAQRFAQEALKKNPDYRPAMVTIARDHYRNRRLDLALYALKAILDGFGDANPPRDKNNADAHLLRGLIYREQGARKQAMEEFQAAIALRPDIVEAKVQLAAFKLEAGDAADAAQLLEGALKYDRTHVIARLNLGDAYRLLGRSADALKEFEWVAAKDSSLAAVHYDLGLLYLFSDKLPGMTPKQAATKAIDEFEQYKKMKPRSTGPDDTEELIARAKSKIAMIDAAAEQPPPAAPAPSAAPAAPAASSAPPSASMPP